MLSASMVANLRSDLQVQIYSLWNQTDISLYSKLKLGRIIQTRLFLVKKRKYGFNKKKVTLRSIAKRPNMQQ